MPDSRGPSTRAVHAGLPQAGQGEPFLPGPTFAAPYHLSGASDASPYGYGRYANPTWTRYEAALGELEGGEAVVFASGMAAISALLHEILAPGDVLVAPSDAYPGIRLLAEEELAKRGVETRLVPTEDAAIREAADGAAVVWVETPSNPGLDVIDVAALVRDVGALVAIDNTLPTPLGQRPLELGAAVSFCSGSKMLTGHSDIVMGHVAVKDPQLAGSLRTGRGRTGAIPGPFEVWLAHRSLATLGVRMERQNANAQALADALRAEGVAGVRYPDTEVAARQMTAGFAPVVCFELADEAAAARFFAATSLVAEATSFGGAHTAGERRARWGDAVAPGFIRMSAGLEDPGDLVADVLQAIRSAT